MGRSVAEGSRNICSGAQEKAAGSAKDGPLELRTRCALDCPGVGSTACMRAGRKAREVQGACACSLLERQGDSIRKSSKK